MTLCVIKRQNDNLAFASDSRITYQGMGYVDFGVKVLAIPVKIYSAVNADTNEQTLDYDHTLGMCFAGNGFQALLIKESIFEILQNLQHVGSYTDFSMDGIARIIFKVYRKVSTDISHIIREQSLTDLIIGGYCPEQNKIRVYKYTYRLVQGVYDYYFSETLLDNGIEFTGSGELFAVDIYQNNPNLDIVHIVREVIRGQQDPGVGGGIQYGDFRGGNFKIYGVEEFIVTNNQPGYVQTLRGINLYKDDFERENKDFHISYKFIQPFQNEADEYMRQSF